MKLTSEQVHWVFGAVLSVLPIPLILNELVVIDGRWPSFIVPIALFAIGLALILDPLIHGRAAPTEYAHETVQHLVLGAMALAVGGVETARALGGLESSAWALALPLGLVIAGLLFFFHAQHQAGVPVLLLVIQHRIMGVILTVAGVTKAVAEMSQAPALRAGWLLLVLVLGLQLLLYTEGGSLLGGFKASGKGHGRH